VARTSFLPEGALGHKKTVRGEAADGFEKGGTRSGADAGALVTELFDGEVELIVFQRLLDHGDRAVGEDAAEHFAVGIAGDDHDGKVRMDQLQLGVDFVTGDIRQFEVEEDEIKLLLFRDGDGFGAGPDDEAAETGFFEELFEEGLEGRIVIDDEHGGLAAFVFLAEHVTIEEAALDAPAAADLDGWELAALNEIIDSRKGDPKVFGGFLYGHQFGEGFVSHGRVCFGGRVG